MTERDPTVPRTPPDADDAELALLARFDAQATDGEGPPPLVDRRILAAARTVSAQAQAQAPKQALTQAPGTTRPGRRWLAPTLASAASVLFAVLLTAQLFEIPLDVPPGARDAERSTADMVSTSAPPAARSAPAPSAALDIKVPAETDRRAPMTAQRDAAADLQARVADLAAADEAVAAQSGFASPGLAAPPPTLAAEPAPIIALDGTEARMAPTAAARASEPRLADAEPARPVALAKRDQVAAFAGLSDDAPPIEEALIEEALIEEVLVEEVVVDERAGEAARLHAVTVTASRVEDTTRPRDARSAREAALARSADAASADQAPAPDLVRTSGVLRAREASYCLEVATLCRPLDLERIDETLVRSLVNQRVDVALAGAMPEAASATLTVRSLRAVD